MSILMQLSRSSEQRSEYKIRSSGIRIERNYEMIKKMMLKSIKKALKILGVKKKYQWYTKKSVDLDGQLANDFVYEKIKESFKNGKGLAVSKFGTIELTAVCAVIRKRRGFHVDDYLDYFLGKGNIFPEEAVKPLYYNAGFFPESCEYLDKYVDLVLDDIKDIDILGSYIDQESYIFREISHCKKIDIEGYYAPFLWKNPWSQFLENKRVLVIHPFVDSIKYQYESHRDELFDDKCVLPELKELLLIKAVQSIAENENNLGFQNWFEALKYMENQIDKLDFDIALIGCGAYGMDLAAYIKRKNKIAIHMAGWTQMLFGVYGNRWLEDQPQFKKYINQYWIRPLESEKPKGVEKVENACYW